ncbi:hypothetical protein ACFL1H_05570 [Nanoarchaeota archaeon]
MTTKTIEDTIKECYELVSDAYSRPNLKGPRIVKEDKKYEETAFLDWINHEIGINTNFIEKLSKIKPMENIIKGLFSHEFGHYFYHPFDLSMHLYLSHQAEKAFDNDKMQLSDIIFPLFTDFMNNVIVTYNGLLKDELKDTMEAHYETCDKGAVWTAMFGAYKELIDLDVELDYSKFSDEKTKQIEDTIKKLTYDDKGNPRFSFRQVNVSDTTDFGTQNAMMMRFYEAIAPLIDIKYIKCGIGMGKSGANIKIKPEDLKGLSSGEKEQVEEAMRKLAKNLPKDIYDEIKKKYSDDKDNINKDPDQSYGIGSGEADLSIANKDTIDYYRELAKAFGIYVRPKRTLSVSSINIPFGKKEFKPSDSPLNIDMRFSGGKTLPGLTKVAKKEQIPYPSTREVIPRLILYKDASGSMPIPSQRKCYGTLAGTIFVLSYLRSNAPVGIALFDSESSEVLYSANEDDLLEVLCGYKGGGTEVDIEKLKKDLKDNPGLNIPIDKNMDVEEMKRHPLFRNYLKKVAKITGFNKLKYEQMTDFVIISDGGIGNIGDLVTFFKANENYRPTIIHTSSMNLDVPGYNQKTSGFYEGITIYRALTREDVINMTKESIENNLLSKYHV